MARQAFAIAGGPAPRDDEDGTSARPADRADAAPDLRSVLRQATAELHRVLDRAPEQRALLAPGIALEEYAAIMAKHHRALAIGEASLAALEAACPTGVPPYRPRLPALEADLAALDAPPPSGSRFEADRRPPVGPATAGARGRYLGTRYVLEGSTQGAVFIAQRLERHLPVLAPQAFAYWRLQAEEAPAWKALSAHLASLPAQGPVATAAIAAAKAAFLEFLRAFDLEAHEAMRPRMSDAAPDGERS